MHLLISSKTGYFYACIPFYSHRAAVSSLYWSQLGPLLFAFLLGDTLSTFPQGHLSWAQHLNLMSPFSLVLWLVESSTILAWIIFLFLFFIGGVSVDYFPSGEMGENQCPLKYGVNQRCNRKQCWYLTSSVVDQDDRLHQVDQHLPQDVSAVSSGWAAVSSYWDNSVKTKKNTIPATQPQQNLLTFTFYSFADFFFLTAFPWDLTIGISLRCPSFRLTCLSSPRFLFPAQIVISALFDFCYVQSRSSTPPVACEEILVALLV